MTKKLQEENKRLKLKLEALEGETPWKDIKDKSEVIGKLTEAKELLHLFLDADTPLDMINAQRKTEQFLKKCE